MAFAYVRLPLFHAGSASVRFSSRESQGNVASVTAWNKAKKQCTPPARRGWIASLALANDRVSLVWHGSTRLIVDWPLGKRVEPNNASGGHFCESLTGFGYRRPALGAVAINVHFGIEPSRIVQSAGFDKGDTGHDGDVRKDW
jgi:hypothetical protein